MLSRPLLALWRHAARRSGGRRTEPAPYRAWKWLWQQRSRRGGWRSDLFERLAATDWDLLILLDACRQDTLAEVAGPAVVEVARSPASATATFLDRARERGVFDGAVYVSANPQSGEHSPGEVTHDPVYRDRWDDRLATVPPDAVYDRAREHLGEGRRVVAHTIQPHYPHVCEIGGETVPVPNGLHPLAFDDERLRDYKLQALLANGHVDVERARASYRSSVAFAWSKASAVAADLSARGYRVVVTADHGELFGEYGFVEHPVDVNVAPLVEVPWVVFEPVVADDGAAVEDRLAALGYAET